MRCVLCGVERSIVERTRRPNVRRFGSGRRFAQTNGVSSGVLSERSEVKGRGRRPLFIFIIIYNLDVGVRAACV